MGVSTSVTAKDVDFDKLAGSGRLWIEVARFPGEYDWEPPNAANVKAYYKWDKSKKALSITNSMTVDVVRSYVMGEAVVDPQYSMNSRLLVKFEPNETTPAVAPGVASFWILLVASDYRYIVVSNDGSGKKRPFWILSEKYTIATTDLQYILHYLKTHFALKNIDRTIIYPMHDALRML